MEGGRRNANDENTKENKLTTKINLVLIFIFYFKNLKEQLKLTPNDVFIYDDLKGIYKVLNNVEISLDNIRDSEGVV
jgi:hypothetical protein